MAQIEEKRDDNGFLRVTLAYMYKVEDERYVGRETFTFIRDEEAARFEVVGTTMFSHMIDQKNPQYRCYIVNRWDDCR